MLIRLVFISLSINLSCANIKELNSVKWSELGLRNVCPLDEFKMQLNNIKHEFKRCIHFKHILLDINSLDPTSNMDADDLEEIEEEKEMQKHFAAITYSKNKLMNPFCKLSKHWTDCIKHVLPLQCLEPNSKSLVPVYLPRTVQEQLRLVYEKHAKQVRMQQLPDPRERNFHSGERELIQHDEKMRQEYFDHMRHLKFEQLADYFKFRCDQRVQLNIDSLDIPKRAQPADVRSPPIDRFQQEAFADLF